MSDRSELLEDYEKTKPEDTDFRQQRLRAWQPLLIPRNVVITFILLGIVFLPIGFVIRYASQQVIQITSQYDQLDCNDIAPAACVKTLDIAITEDIPKPVYFYYKLTNFYQNHRRYVKSRSDGQLSGTIDPTTSTCDPLEQFDNKTMYPCGLISSSYFNDTFSAQLIPKSSTTPQNITEWSTKGISWVIDREEKFNDLYINDPGSFPSDLTREGPQGTMPNLDDEHLMNWMRPAAFPTFRKLYAFINTDLEKDQTLRITVNDEFNNRQYDGTKSIVISNASWIGGRNDFLANLYIIVGSFCFFMAIVVFLKQLICPRRLGNMSSVVALQKVQHTD